jgi:hypothetical protein
MHLLLYMRRQYNSPLPPAALLGRLQYAVPSRPAGLFWWLGSLYLPCQGKVAPATSSFRARMRWGCSNGAIIKGDWQSIPTALSPTGTTVRLVIHPPWSKLLLSYSSLSFVALIILLSRSIAEPVPWVPPALPGVMAILWTGIFWGDIHHAERHFQEALLLSKAAG